MAAMTTFDPCTVPSCPLATDHGTATARDTNRPSSSQTGRPRPDGAGMLRRAVRWAAGELRAGAEISARRDAVRTVDERRYLERP